MRIDEVHLAFARSNGAFGPPLCRRDARRNRVGPLPNVRVRLVGEDGNAFAILGRVCGALRRAHVPQDRIEAFTREATAEDYDHLLVTVLEWVVVEDFDQLEQEHEAL